MKIIIKRIAAAIPVLFIVSIMVFLMLQLLPGDPATVILGQEATPEAVEAMREQLGLNQPLLIQYLHWLGKCPAGEFGPVTG